MAPALPTPDLIETKAIVEGSAYDFKEEIDLDTEGGKAKFINDVIAFLNKGAGHLIVGVKEKKGAFTEYRPVREDPHKLIERIQSIVQSSIDPAPRGIEVHPLEMDGGHVLDIRIPEHRMQPYQNKLTGGFYKRTDRQNAPIPRDEIWSYFKRFEDYQSALKQLSSDEAATLAERDTMADEGPVLTISILPREHFDGHPPFTGRNGMVIRHGPAFPHSKYPPGVGFRACAGGVEAVFIDGNGKGISRLFLSDEWFIQAIVVHPFSATDGGHRVTIRDMEAHLAAYLEDIRDLTEEAGVRGPFCVAIEFSQLKRNERVAWVFHTNGPVRHAPRGLVERLDPVALAKASCEVVVRASTYG